MALGARRDYQPPAEPRSSSSLLQAAFAGAAGAFRAGSALGEGSDDTGTELRTGSISGTAGTCSRVAATESSERGRDALSGRSVGGSLGLAGGRGRTLATTGARGRWLGGGALGMRRLAGRSLAMRGGPEVRAARARSARVPKPDGRASFAGCGRTEPLGRALGRLLPAACPAAIAGMSSCAA